MALKTERIRVFPVPLTPVNRCTSAKLSGLSTTAGNSSRSFPNGAKLSDAMARNIMLNDMTPPLKNATAQFAGNSHCPAIPSPPAAAASKREISRSADGSSACSCANPFNSRTSCPRSGILDCGGKAGAATPLSPARASIFIRKLFVRTKAAWRSASRRSP